MNARFTRNSRRNFMFEFGRMAYDTLRGFTNAKHIFAVKTHFTINRQDEAALSSRKQHSTKLSGND